MRILLPLTILALGSHAGAQSFAPRPLDQDGVLALDAPFSVLSGGTAAGLGVPIATGDTHGVAWTDAGTLVLPFLPGHEVGEANAIAPDGTVVGKSGDVVQVGQLFFIFEDAVVWPGGGAAVEVQSLVTSGPPLELLETLDIDSSGVLMGLGRDASIPALRGWVLENGVLTDIGAISPDRSVIPRDRSEAGVVVGEADSATGQAHAFKFENGVMVDLHVASGVPGFVSEANAVNESGTIAGAIDLVPDGIQLETAALWAPDGTLQPLPTLGGQQAAARGINAAGDAVGYSVDSDGDLRAALWEDGVVHDLNDLIPAGSGWTLLVANAIADDGHIVGEGAFGGSIRAYLLEPECASCTNYCISTPNSSGGAASMATEGWESVGAQFLTLVAEPLPALQNGLFYFGPETAQVPFGNGFRCVAAGALALFRLPITTSTPTGRLATAIDFDSPPAATRLLPGTTWNFQAWFRDPAGGGTSFNLSDGLTVTFEP